MNKKNSLLIALVCGLFFRACAASLPAAAAVAATAPKGSMIKGTQQRVAASNVKIKKLSNNRNLPVIQVWKTFENANELIITALNPGVAEIIVENFFNGNRIYRTFVISVQEEKKPNKKDEFFKKFKEEWNKQPEINTHKKFF